MAVRVSNNVTCRVRAHREEVCGLKWSNEGNLLASGGNENLIYIWDPRNMSSSKFMHQLSDHTAAVKALAWCPYQFNVLASGGGTKDGCIKIWNAQRGKCLHSVDTKAQAINNLTIPLRIISSQLFYQFCFNLMKLVCSFADLWSGVEQAS